MKQLKKDLQSVVKELKALIRQTEKMAKKVEKLEKVKAVKKPTSSKTRPPKRKPAKKIKKVPAVDVVLGIIKRSKAGVNTTTLKKKTGFNDQKIRDNIYKLRKQGRIKSKERGIYLKA